MCDNCQDDTCGNDWDCDIEQRSQTQDNDDELIRAQIRALNQILPMHHDPDYVRATIKELESMLAFDTHVCTCGAKHTSNPKYHMKWCSAK